jgi:menaquinone-dependent protoporphyrinogen oxidase
MARILILAASVDGQTARIAERVCAVLVRSGHEVATIAPDAAAFEREIGKCGAVIVGAAIRYGRHVRDAESLVRRHVAAVSARPNAFFSVSLSAGGPGARPATASRYVEAFCQRSGWQPRQTAIFGGALRYTKYNALIRIMMRIIVGVAGGDTDTSRDYEYTDWDAVERFAADFAARL